MRPDAILNLLMVLGLPVMGLALVIVVPGARSAPGRYGALASFLCAIGLVLFATAKLSVIRRGTLVSFGPARMTSGYRRLYRWGYALMGVALFLLLAASAAPR